MNHADRACNLECQKHIKRDVERHEFVGPVKIILVDPSPAEYKRKIWGSGAISLAIMLMGASAFTVLFFTLSFTITSTAANMHVFFCTVGFQILMPSGILMFSSLFGGSAHMKNPDRRLQHFLIQVTAIVFSVFGTVVVVLGVGLKFTLHSVSGFFATGLIVTSSLIGPTVYFSNPSKTTGYFNKLAHIYCAVPTVLLSTFSFILGLTKESFLKWAPIKDLPYIIAVFTVLYILAVLGSVLMRLKYGY